LNAPDGLSAERLAMELTAAPFVLDDFHGGSVGSSPPLTSFTLQSS
jgi:hypothetical protein